MNNAFIIGTGRCGTTYLAQILNAHSKICVPPEMQCVFEYDTNGSRFYESIALDAIVDADAAADLLERSCPHDLARFFNYRDYCEGLTYPLRSMQAFFAGYYDAIAKSHNKEILIEQTPWYGQRLDIMTRVFPDAKFIHVVRDGRDVALSFARTPWWFKKVELNLARWANEIKKIAADAAALLCPENYLVVKYEDLVADTDAEVSRICEFLGIAMETAQLDPSGYIDYDSYCRFDMDDLSSTAYLKWKKNKGSSSSFQGSAYAWKKDKTCQFSSLPDRVKASLSLFGYEVPDDIKDAKEEILSHYNVKLYVATLEAKVTDLRDAVNGRELTINDQSVHIRSIESELSLRAKRLAEFEQELVARGEHIAGLTSTINDQIKHISSLDTEFSHRAEHAAALEKELLARGEHIAGLNNTINDQIKHISGLDVELSERAKRIVDFEAELRTRELHIAGQTKAIEDLTQSIQDHETDRLARVRLQSEMAAELAMRIEQFKAYEAEVIACAERRAVLEKALADQAQHIQHLGSELSLCSERLSEYEADAVSSREQSAELDRTISAQMLRINSLDAAVLSAQEQIAGLNSSAARQTEHISELTAQLSVRLDRISELEEEKNVQESLVRVLQNEILTQQASIVELSADVQLMKKALDQLNATWCGRLQAFRQKLHK
ncbi:sulfotransferase [Pseudomonas fluorescens]|uniref:sulfotransferase n=1 Tax=Pseudomonas fluorescens TaxID=294 RepID=UPI0027331316|nr:sulfotransferase [Pseudomonas fluorescens]WLH72325.1 sulfotransferase [Pseudomonas fluorescens]